VTPSASDPDTIVGLNLLAANTDCSALVDTCLARGALFPDEAPEVLTYTNASGSTQTYLLQVATGSNTGSSNQPFSLNVTITP